jgi:hypothetical protein
MQGGGLLSCWRTYRRRSATPPSRTAGGSGYSPSALPPNMEGGDVDAVISLALPLGLTLVIPGIVVLIIVIVLVLWLIF